jgi:hypothetical protein
MSLAHDRRILAAIFARDDARLGESLDVYSAIKDPVAQANIGERVSLRASPDRQGTLGLLEQFSFLFGVRRSSSIAFTPSIF